MKFDFVSLMEILCTLKSLKSESFHEDAEFVVTGDVAMFVFQSQWQLLFLSYKG